MSRYCGCGNASFFETSVKLGAEYVNISPAKQKRGGRQKNYYTRLGVTQPVNNSTFFCKNAGFYVEPCISQLLTVTFLDSIRIRKSSDSNSFFEGMMRLTMKRVNIG